MWSAIEEINRQLCLLYLQILVVMLHKSITAFLLPRWC